MTFELFVSQLLVGASKLPRISLFFMGLRVGQFVFRGKNVILIVDPNIKALMNPHRKIASAIQSLSEVILHHP